MASKSEQKNQTRRQLIQAGLRLSGEKGFGALSLREVAVAAGITPAAYYKHFHDLEELGLVLLDEVGLSLRQMLRDARKRVEPGPDALKVSIETFLGFVNDNGNLFRLLLGERQGATPAFRKAIHSEMDRFVMELATDLERLQLGIDQPLRNPSLTAECIVAVVFTLGAEALDLPKHKQIGLTTRMIEHVRTILRGSLKKEPQIRTTANPRQQPQRRKTR